MSKYFASHIWGYACLHQLGPSKLFSRGPFWETASVRGSIPKEHRMGLKAYVLQEQGNLLELVDRSLGSKYPEEEAMRMLSIALLCTNPSPLFRPTMSSVVRMLEGKIPVQAPQVKRGPMKEDSRLKGLERLTQESQTWATPKTVHGR
ncbi:hypothetical protein RJ639_046486 [Escallonia herrerae]|uniref:Uncharacterized protein n=1 Tax=Escallonia herrerae TaxID=1293975 RepID=A0AA89B088_9ASTE|nr:hypothetical protein RJ639_046486 [Escallonia herrerae]